MRTSGLTRGVLAIGALLAACMSAPAARAFCGFYVGGADAKLFNNATQVVLMRHGQRTVLSMGNDYQGPPERFAMVVPVPVVLKKEDVKTLSKDVLERIDRLTAPRLVEYWEQDPCRVEEDDDESPQKRTKAGGKSRSAPAAADAKELGVTVEAQFTVGEYEIVILSAKDSSGLDAWLRQEKYAIPEGAEPYLRPYVQSGSKFFVARVDPTKVKFAEGMAQLSPLRFHYDSAELALPIRLGLINSSGTQDLIVNVLAKGQRYEPSNRPSVTIPTNLDLAEGAKERFGPFYAALFDRTIEKNPNAIVTEYAWDASTCDPCPGPALTGADLSTLGGDAVVDEASRSSLVRLDPPDKNASQDPVRRNVTRVVVSRTRACHAERRKAKVDLEGHVDVALTYGAQGVVEKVTVPRNDTKDKELADCIVQGMKTSTFHGAAPGASAVVPLAVSVAVNVSPRGWTLTRLHARYGKDIGQDIVFRAAPPIAGGREVRKDGLLEHGSESAGMNNFQARYAIRHPWTGPIKCDHPRRGIWGGPPAGTPHGSGPTAARDLAFVKRGGVDLPSLVRSDAPEIDLKSTLGPVVAPVASTGGATPPAPDKKGCAGCTTHPAPLALDGAALAALGLALVARRRSRRSRS